MWLSSACLVSVTLTESHAQCGCILRTLCYPLCTLCYQHAYPSPLRSLAFVKWDESIDGVEQPPGPTLDLHLMLSVSFSHRSRVSPKLSVVGRRRFRLVRALATC